MKSHSQSRKDRWNRQSTLWAFYVESNHERLDLLHRVLCRIAASTPNPATILELGCGEGVFCRLMQKHFPSAQITGIDFSESLIEIAKTRSATIDYQVLDFEHPEGMTFAEPKDLVVAIFSFLEAESLDRAIQNARATLSPRGRLVIVVTDPFIDIAKFRNGNLRNARLSRHRGSDWVLKSNFLAEKHMPSGTYCRILRPISAYLDAAAKQGMEQLNIDVVSTAAPPMNGGTTVFLLSFVA